ncbi:MAG: PTS sugar transporter subunit IIB [Erysipelotrichaceae bacterium]|nr:PTS sugar transporter subunit IIB [Erysipelotrichaceae bacterium]MBP5279739.1 PTS sugar transporter subunit IIB [Erysipelotrichaceae bacterium]
MKRILLCCGTGVATSTVVNKKVEGELKARGHNDFTISQCKAAEVPSKSGNFDLCVTTVPLSYKCDCPIVVATGIIINRGTKEIYDAIEEALWAE